MLLRNDEVQELKSTVLGGTGNLLESFKKAIVNNTWVQDKDLSLALERPLVRLCARYLYLEKRRSYALNPVGEHISYLICRTAVVGGYTYPFQLLLIVYVPSEYNISC